LGRRLAEDMRSANSEGHREALERGDTAKAKLLVEGESIACKGVGLLNVWREC